MNSAFPNQVASGDTTQTSTVLWTRSTTLGSVSFEYSTNSDFSCILGTFCQTVTDPLLPVKHEVQDLSPGTQYFYRVTDATGNTASGQFKTAADPWTKTGLHFGVSGDWRGELSPYPAIRNAPERNLDFFVELGDTIYADFASPDVPLPQAQTLDEFRAKHNEVYSSRLGLNTLADLRASTSVLSTLDDHEVTNDFAGGAPAASDPRFGITTGLINDTPLFETGVQAFQEYNPIRNEFYGDTGDPRTAGEQKLYRANTYGQDAAVFLLDARSFRDQELSPVANPTDPAQVGAFLARSFDIDPATGQPTPRRTLLGNQQLADLKRDLLKADHDGVTWKFVNLPEPIQNLGVTAASDRYEGYAAERTELLKFIDVNHINNVVFVTADLHGTLVNNLTYQEGPGQTQKATNAFEIVTGSVGFDAPLGPTLVNYAASLGLVPTNQKAFYDALPVANDSDSIVNDKDDFLKQLINAQLAPLGYDPIGLNANLPAAQGLIDATLLQGDYVAGHTYGWTAFDIDQSSQKLTVTTYGIAPYTEAELNAGPAGIAALQPQIVSQFTVNPKIVTPSEIFVFGDSLSDTGNFSDFTSGLLGLPIPQPPYAPGRLSNGELAVESLAKKLGPTFSLDRANNFAFAGATTGKGNTNEDDLSLFLGKEIDLPGLRDQIDAYANKVGPGGADSKALHIVWAGPDDFLDSLLGSSNADPAVLLREGTLNLADASRTLASLGAKNIVLPNMANLGRLPAAQANPIEAAAVSKAFNASVALELGNLDFKVTEVDLFSAEEAVAKNPAEFGFSNVTDPVLPPPLDPVIPRPAPDPEKVKGSFFWDPLHPTTQGHAFLADTIYKTFTGEISQLTFNDIPGTDKSDVLKGTSGNDNIDGYAGNDILNGREGNDRIEGWDGNDQLYGNQGDDILSGGDGADSLFGGQGNDIGFGGNGNDQLFGNVGNDILIGDAGDDLIWGGQGDDYLLGGEGQDSLWGNAGNDILNGGMGKDALFGGLGDDRLDGGAENDLLTGGRGKDQFVYRPGSGADEITDFSLGDDRIDLTSFGTGFNTTSLTLSGNIIDFGGGNTLRLTRTDVSILSASDFIFA